jgi:hypothetical protein
MFENELLTLVLKPMFEKVPEERPIGLAGPAAVGAKSAPSLFQAP